MRAILLTLTGIAAAACAAIIAPAAVAEAATESAQVTIATLEAQGFDVKLDRLGSAPLRDCVVTDVRNPQERTRLIRRDDDFFEVVDRRTITVSLDCSRR
jgi:hypothetical protein